jgi:hypothetical protein
LMTNVNTAEGFFLQSLQLPYQQNLMIWLKQRLKEGMSKNRILFSCFQNCS